MDPILPAWETGEAQSIAPSRLPECRGKPRHPERDLALLARSKLGQFDRHVYHCATCRGFRIGRPVRRHLRGRHG